MPDYASSQIALIDSRIRQALKTGTKMGTVQSRATTGPSATVSLHGSSGTAQPVKCFASVLVEPGDRVGLINIEDDWIIVGNYTLRTLADVHYDADFSSTGNVASTTYVDMPNSPTVSLTKRFDATILHVAMAFSCYVGTANSTIFGGVHLARADGTGTPADYQVFRRAINAANDHRDQMGSIRIPGSLPAGDYLVTARWRLAGAGPTIYVDSNDGISIDVREVV